MYYTDFYKRAPYLYLYFNKYFIQIDSLMSVFRI